MKRVRFIFNLAQTPTQNVIDIHLKPAAVYFQYNDYKDTKHIIQISKKSVILMYLFMDNRNTTRRCRTKKCIARSWSNLVNEPEG